MKRERAAELWPIIKAFSEGKTVQVFTTDDKRWKDLTNPRFNNDYAEYRIKPEPREFYVYVTKNGGTFVSVHGDISTRQSTEVIKVREVDESSSVETPSSIDDPIDWRE